MKELGPIAAVIAGLVIVILAFGVRAVVESGRHYEAAAQAEEDGDEASAILHYRRTIQWYAPVGGRTSPAYNALVRIGDDRRDAGDVPGALFAYRSARSAVMSTRHVAIPLARALPALHQRIAELMAEQTGGGPAAAERFYAQLEDHRARRPNPALGFLAGGVFVAWLGTLLGAAWRGFSEDGAVRWSSMFRWLGVSAVLLLGWLSLVRFA